MDRIILPVLGPGSQPDDDPPHLLDLPMGVTPREEPPVGILEDSEHAPRILGILDWLLRVLERAGPGTAESGVRPPVSNTFSRDLRDLPKGALDLLDEILGEGEVLAKWEEPPFSAIQETVFAGVWRVRQGRPADREFLRVGAFPDVSRRKDLPDPEVPSDGPMPEGVMNAPSVLAEIREAAKPPPNSGTGPTIINLTLLPLSPEDRLWLDQSLGIGPLDALSRGYGNCRVIQTAHPRVWRVRYYNASDALILDTVEVGDIPMAITAAQEDFEDSRRRLLEVREWVLKTSSPNRSETPDGLL